MTDSGTKCAWVIHESKAVQIHVHNNRCCLFVPQVPGSIENLHNNNFASDIYQICIKMHKLASSFISDTVL